jgi:hypothetical protein
VRTAYVCIAGLIGAFGNRPWCTLHRRRFSTSSLSVTRPRVASSSIMSARKSLPGAVGGARHGSGSVVRELGRGWAAGRAVNEPAHLLTDPIACSKHAHEKLASIGLAVEEAGEPYELHRPRSPCVRS